MPYEPSISLALSLMSPSAQVFITSLVHGAHGAKSLHANNTRYWSQLEWTTSNMIPCTDFDDLRKKSIKIGGGCCSDWNKYFAAILAECSRLKYFSVKVTDTQSLCLGQKLYKHAIDNLTDCHLTLKYRDCIVWVIRRCCGQCELSWHMDNADSSWTLMLSTCVLHFNEIDLDAVCSWNLFIQSNVEEHSSSLVQFGPSVQCHSQDLGVSESMTPFVDHCLKYNCLLGMYV